MFPQFNILPRPFQMREMLCFMRPCHDTEIEAIVFKRLYQVYSLPLVDQFSYLGQVHVELSNNLKLRMNHFVRNMYECDESV